MLIKHVVKGQLKFLEAVKEDRNDTEDDKKAISR